MTLPPASIMKLACWIGVILTGPALVWKVSGDTAAVAATALTMQRIGTFMVQFYRAGESQRYSRVMSFSESFFASRFGIQKRDLENYLSEALSQGGDYADLYFEYLATSLISMDESIVKSATQGVSLGVGVRVIAGERTGYAYSDDLSPEKIRKAARVAAHIANAPSKVDKFDLNEGVRHNLYPVLVAPTETAFADRVELVKRADRAARAYDPRIFQVQAAYADNLRQVMVATSDGVLTLDRQPLARMSVSALARQNGGDPQRGHSGGGGRVELEFFLKEKT